MLCLTSINDFRFAGKRNRKSLYSLVNRRPHLFVLRVKSMSLLCLVLKTVKTVRKYIVSYFKKVQTLFKHLLGTIFSCGLIHMWCSGEYLQQQHRSCVIDSKQTAVCVFMVMKERHPVQQCGSLMLYKTNNIDQPLDTQIILCNWFWCFHGIYQPYEKI